MKVSIAIGGAASGRQRDMERQVEYVVEAEKLGVDSVWTAEAWGLDAVTPLAYIAAKTSKIKLGTGIMQISARVPAMTAMTAMTLAALSNDRFILGLGVSGPQVVEGLQGRSFRALLTRLKETIEIIRMAFRGEKLQFDGRYHQLPLPNTEGKALRLAQPANTDIPIYLATLGPNALRYTGAEADGWLGTSFTPEHAGAHMNYLREGAESKGRTLRDLDLLAGGTVAFVEDDSQLVADGKSGLAFSLGAMGSAQTNFYNEAYQRGGWEEAAKRVQRLWVEGRRDEAVNAVPDDMVRQVNLFGDDAAVLARVKTYEDAGITTLRAQPYGRGLSEQLACLGRLMDLIKDV